MSIEKQIADFKAEFNTRIAELEKQLTKKAPVVPWVGAFVQSTNGGDPFYASRNNEGNSFLEIIDSPLHPQFMPNDGVNPWPDYMEVQIIYTTGDVETHKSSYVDWVHDDIIHGSRPACGWAEYLKEK